MTHRNKGNGKLVTAVKFSEKTKYNVVELFKGGGQFCAVFETDAIIVTFADERPTFVVKLGEFAVKEADEPIISYAPKLFKDLYEVVK